MADVADRRITYLLKVTTDPKAADAFAQIAKMSDALDKKLSFTAKVGAQSATGMFGGGPGGEDVKVAEATNGHLKKREALLEANGKVQQANAAIIEKTKTAVDRLTQSEKEYADTALAGLHAKADALAADLAAKEAPKEAEAAARELEKRLAAEKKVDAERFKAKTENLKEMQAWEDKQMKFEQDAQLKRAAAGKRSTDQAASDAQHAAALVREANQKVIDSFGQGVSGALQLGRAFALAGLIGQEDFGKVRDTILGVQTAIDTVKGGMDVWKSFSSLSELGRGAGAVGAAAQMAGGAAGAAGAGGAAGGGGLAAALAPAVSALGPFALGLGAATAAVLALKYGADKADEARAQQEYREARLRRPGVFEEDKTMASGQAPGGFAMGLAATAAAINNFNPFAYAMGHKWQSPTEIEREGGEHRQKSTDTKAAIDARADETKQTAEIAAREAAQARARFEIQDKQAAAAASLDKFGPGGGANEASKLNADLESAKEKYAALGDLAARFKEMGAGAGAELKSTLEQQEGVQQHILDLAHQQYDLQRSAAVKAIEGLRDQLTLQEQLWAKEKAGADAALKSIHDQIDAKKNAAKSDAERFGEMNPFQQRAVADVLRKKQAGEELSDRELKTLKEAGFSSQSDFVHRKGAEKGERDLKSFNIRDAFYTEEQQKSDRESADLVAGESNDVAGNAARGRGQAVSDIGKIGGEVNVKANGEFTVNIRRDYDAGLAAQVLEAVVAGLKPHLKGMENEQDEKMDMKIRQALQRLNQTRNAK